jgi:RNA polymerase sigma-70 factor (ECF subfamily)
MDYHQLITGLRKEDSKAINHLLDEWTPSLFYFANRLINNSNEANEIVTRCLLDFLLTFRHKPIEIKDEHHFSRLLYKRVWQRCSDYLDALSVQNKFLSTLPQDFTIDQLIDNTYIIRKVHNAIEKLPKSCRQIAKLYYVHDLKQKNIAEQLGISPNTVRNQLKIALDKLRSMLSDDDWKVFILIFSCGSFSMN